MIDFFLISFTGVFPFLLWMRMWFGACVSAFAASLPTTYKIKGKKLKILLRELNRRMFPPEFTDRPKYGFSFPMARWFQNELADFARTIVLDGSLVGTGLFNRDTVADILDTHRAGKRDLGLQIWYLINLEIWHRLFILGEDREHLRADIAEQLGKSGAHSGDTHSAA